MGFKQNDDDVHVRDISDGCSLDGDVDTDQRIAIDMFCSVLSRKNPSIPWRNIAASIDTYRNDIHHTRPGIIQRAQDRSDSSFFLEQRTRQQNALAQADEAAVFVRP